MHAIRGGGHAVTMQGIKEGAQWPWCRGSAPPSRLRCGAASNVAEHTFKRLRIWQ